MPTESPSIPYTTPEPATEIAPNSPLTHRLLGSQPTVSALRHLGSIGRPEAPVSRGLAPEPPIFVSAPDFAFQVRDLRADVPCPSPNDDDELVETIRESAQIAHPNSDVRAVCQQTVGERRVLTVGIWILPPASEASNQGRDIGLQRVNLLFPEDTFGFVITSGVLQRQVAGGFNQQPKRLDHNGNADPDGPVHLTGIDLRLTGPDTITTKVTGFDSTPWPDVPFTITINDRLSVDGSPNVVCDSDQDLETDTSWHFVLAALTLRFPPLAAFFFIEGIIAETRDPPSLTTSVGSSAAQQFVPGILLPPSGAGDTGLRLVFSYQRINITKGGIFTGGTYLPVPRIPEAQIVGPTLLFVDFRAASVSQNYRFTAEDLRGRLTTQWSGDGTIDDPTRPSTTVRFNTSGNAAGTVLRRTLRVSVTDTDSLNATAEIDIEIRVTDLNDDTIPPICRVKPWLPQCDLV